MKNLPPSVSDHLQTYEITVEDESLMLIVCTNDGDFQTFQFDVLSDGSLELESQSETGTEMEGELPESVRMLLSEHPLISPNSIS